MKPLSKRQWAKRRQHIRAATKLAVVVVKCRHQNMTKEWPLKNAHALPAAEPAQLSVEEISEYVGHIFKVTLNEMAGQSNRLEFVAARRVAMALACRLTKVPMIDIATRFNRIVEDTVTAACDRYDPLIDEVFGDGPARRPRRAQPQRPDWLSHRQELLVLQRIKRQKKRKMLFDLAHHAVAMVLARHTIARETGNILLRPSIRQICAITARTYGITPADILSRRCIAHIAIPRIIAMALACRFTGLSFFRIAQQFERTDHTTVLSACRIGNPILDRTIKGAVLARPPRRGIRSNPWSAAAAMTVEARCVDVPNTQREMMAA
jgi:chromosomal replication initiation ATPase DnaA